MCHQEAEKHDQNSNILPNATYPNHITANFFCTNITTKNMQIIQEMHFKREYKQYLKQNFNGMRTHTKNKLETAQQIYPKTPFAQTHIIHKSLSQVEAYTKEITSNTI